MDFYYLKLGKRNHLARLWLRGDNPLQRPAAVIFFGRVSVDQLIQGEPVPALTRLTAEQRTQALDFVNSALPERRESTVMVVVADGWVWLLQPDGEVVERVPLPGEPSDDSLWKMMPVKILAEKRMADVPPVLAGINSDTYLVQGTYRKIRHRGTIKAIHTVLGLPLPLKHLQPQELTAAWLLECLGSVGLETLVAKLFEAAGCFVPAYRGGTMQHVDLFAHNDGSEPIALGDLLIPPGKCLSIQVKSNKVKKKPAGADCLIALTPPAEAACYDAEWLLAQVRRYSPVLAWLERSLSWLPADFLARFR